MFALFGPIGIAGNAHHSGDRHPDFRRQPPARARQGHRRRHQELQELGMKERRQVALRLQDEADVARSPRHALPIEKLQQRDRILPRHAVAILERRHIHRGAAARRLRLQRASLPLSAARSASAWKTSVSSSHQQLLAAAAAPSPSRRSRRAPHASAAIAAASGGFSPPRRYASTIAARTRASAPATRDALWPGSASRSVPTSAFAAFRSSSTFSKIGGADLREHPFPRFFPRQAIAHRIAPV